MTNHSSQEQRTKAHFSGILRLKKITEANGIKEAARHNRRELLPELKTSLRIDPSLTYKNEVLCGPSSADEIPRLADELLKKASARVVRKDAVRAIEIIFSLPKNFEIDERASNTLSASRVAVTLHEPADVNVSCVPFTTHDAEPVSDTA